MEKQNLNLQKKHLLSLLINQFIYHFNLTFFFFFNKSANHLANHCL